MEETARARGLGGREPRKGRVRSSGKWGEPWDAALSRRKMWRGKVSKPSGEQREGSKARWTEVRRANEKMIFSGLLSPLPPQTHRLI